MAGTNLGWRTLIDLGNEGDIALLEVIFGNSLHLFKDVLHFKVGGGLGECALRNVVNLFEVEDAM